MSEVTEIIELVTRMTELAQTAVEQRHRAEGLASRHIRLTKEIDEALGIVDDETKREIQKLYGAGLEGRVKFLLEKRIPGIYMDRVQS